MDRLQRQLDHESERHASEITNLHSQNGALRRRLRDAILEQNAANAAVAEATAALEHVRVRREIDYETMMAQVQLLSKEAALAATADERARGDAALQRCLEKHKDDQAAKSRRVRELEKAVGTATAKLHILEASVATMLLEQAEVLRTEHKETEEAMAARHAKAAADLAKAHKLEAEALRNQIAAADAAKFRAEHHAAVAVRDALTEASKSAAMADVARDKLQAAQEELSELRDQLDAFRLGPCPEDRPLSHYCKAILTEAEYDVVSKISSLDNLGVEAASVDAMGERRRRDLATVCDLLVSRILVNAKAGTPDPPGILRAITKLRSAAKSAVGAALLEHAAFDPTEHPTTKALALSYVRCIQSGDKATARSMLSVLVSSGELTDAQVASLCSLTHPVKVGDVVIVSGTGAHDGATRKHMKVAALNLDTASLSPLVGTQACPFEVPHAQYRSLHDVMCTSHQIHEAKIHALKTFPGAKVTPVITRTGGIDPVRATFVAGFLRDPTVVEVVEASLSKAKRIKWRLKQRPWPLWKRLVNRMENEGLKPVSWGHFWGLVANGEYELQTADNCCCGTCRDLGYRNYSDLRDIIQTLRVSIEAASDGRVTAQVADLLARVKKEEDFRKGSFISHLSDSSPVGAHCLTMLLSSSVDRRFRKSCSHGRSDGRVVPPPETMEQMLGRKPKSGDWNDACEICCDKKGVKEETGNVFKCSHCNIVAHKVCIERSHWDLPSSKADSWTCAECVREIDDCQHDSSCDSCNEAEFILADVQRLIEVLRSVEHEPPATEVLGTQKAKGGSKAPVVESPKGCGGGVEALASEILASRLEQFASKQQQYISHLIRDRNQSCFKGLTEETLTLHGFYVLMDYWAKFNSRKADVACCEGNQIGISTHGMMFIYLNPSVAERAEIDREHGPQQWERFGPARDEAGGLRFLEENFNVFCDDAKQGTFHTQSEVEATIRAFLAGRPWLDRSRCAFVQSDNASNYRDPTTEVMCRSIGVRCFSEAGMGKDEGDANAGVIKGLFASKLDEGHDLECAGDLFRHATGFKVKGERYGILKVDRRYERRVSGRVSMPHISNYGLWTLDESTITFYESLDVASSRESMLRGGKAVGFGEGVKLTIAEFNMKHSTQLSVTGATLDLTDDSNVKQRRSREEKFSARNAQEQKKASKALAIQDKAAAASSAAEAHFNGAVEQCPRCEKRFLTPGWYSRHKVTFCPKRSEIREARKRARRIDVILHLHDERVLQDHKERLDRLRDVCVRLSGSGRIGLSVNPHSRAVVRMNEKGLAFISGKIDLAFVLVAIDGAPVAIDGAPLSSGVLSVLDGELSLGRAIDLTFKRPTPPLPLHGIARKGIHKSVQYLLHEKQLEWLHANVFSGGRTLMRDKPAADAMKAHFHCTLREDTMTPMWLDQEKISSWLSARTKEEKDRRRAAQRADKSTSAGSASASAPKKVHPKKRPRHEKNDEEGESGAEDSSCAGSNADSGSSDSEEE